MSGLESKSGFESIVGQQKPIRLLIAHLQNKTIPHALLFTGLEGIGKQATATAFAMACNCQYSGAEVFVQKAQTSPIAQDRRTSELSCGSCKSCRKIQSSNHPDIIYVKPSGLFIKIEQIRELGHTLAMKPFEARLRVVILSDAQNMTTAAGNALLKLLEEPPDRTILILLARQRSELLPTIVSRCQHIRFNPISREALETMLIEEQGTTGDDAAIVAAIANGSFSKALAMIDPKNQTNWINRRNWLIQEVDALPSRPIGLVLAWAAKLSKNKELLFDSLEIIKTYLRDLVIYNYDPEKLINKDMQNQVRKASQKVAVSSLLTQINYIRSAQENIQGNANLRLTVEVLALRLAIP